MEKTTEKLENLLAASLNEELELGIINIKVPKEIKDDLKRASKDKQVVKFISDQYKQAQNYRIRQQNQCRALVQNKDISEFDHFSFIDNMAFRSIKQEKLYEKYLDIMTKEIPVCKWMRSITGIGPVFAAYLYSRFDVTKGHYSTDFLSYAGLNDNNNPWLGTDKAKLVTNNAIGYREKKFDSFKETLMEYCNDGQYNKLVADIKKMSIKEIDVDMILNKIEKNVSTDLSDKLDLSLITDWAKWIKNPKICDDILIDFCAAKLGRKFSNVKKGVNTAWDIKSSPKSEYPTVDDLSSYLAKPPYNTELKKNMYLIGASFAKCSGRDRSLYGKIYKQKKLEYLRKNEDGEYADQAKAILDSKNFSNDNITRRALLEGKLTNGHLDARARRYAVKLFISHVFEAMYYNEYHEEPPKTYVIQYMGHHDYIGPEVDYRPFIDGKR